MEKGQLFQTWSLVFEKGGRTTENLQTIRLLVSCSWPWCGSLEPPAWWFTHSEIHCFSHFNLSSLLADIGPLECRTKVLRPVAVPITHLHTEKDVGQIVATPTDLSEPKWTQVNPHFYTISRCLGVSPTFHAHILSDISNSATTSRGPGLKDVDAMCQKGVQTA